MAIYGIYFSPTQSTEKIVKSIGKEFGKVNPIDLSSNKTDYTYTFTKEDVCIIGVPSYGGRVPALAIERIKQFQGNHASVIGVVTYGNREYDDTLLELSECLKECGFEFVAGITSVAEHSIMHQYASGRPDSNDLLELQQFAQKILTKLKNKSDHSDFILPGNHPYKKYNGIPLKPKATKKCTKCKVCARLCPAGAISLSDPSKTDQKLCISCMRCIKVCPEQARKVNPLLVAVASKSMKKVCSIRKENELFI